MRVEVEVEERDVGEIYIGRERGWKERREKEDINIELVAVLY